MSWFDATGFANLAKTALKGAQKTIDKALDIKDEDLNASESQTAASIDAFGDTFFNAWGVDEPAVKVDDSLGPVTSPPAPSDAEASVVTQPTALPKKLTSSTSLWGSFTGSFFENPKNTTEGESSSISKDASPSRPTNLVTEGRRGGKAGAFRSISLELPVHSKVSGDQSSLLSPAKDDSKKATSTETQSVGDTAPADQHQKRKEAQESVGEEEGAEEEASERTGADDGSSIRDEIRNYPAVEVVMRERKPRNYTNRLSAISSEGDRRSLESCEVIGSLTPESERTTSISTSSSVARLRQSGSFGSVEVLTSPSSVEVLGSSSSNTTSVDDTNKERYSSDSISPVAENEGVEVIPELMEDEEEPSLAEDSYTSASESTLNTTVLEYGHPSTDRRLDIINWDYALEDMSPRDGVLSRSSTTLMQTSMNQSCSSLGGIEQVPLSLLGSDLQTTPTSKLSESVSDIFRPITGEETCGVLEPSSHSGSSVTLVADNMTSEEPPSSDCGIVVLQPSGDSSKLRLLQSSGESGKLAGESEAGVLNSSSCEEGTLMGSSCEEDVRMQESTTSTSSFMIKNMIADAMTEKAKEQSPQSSERLSDAKIGSSEHTSGDELETATSSDIEVISSPTPNGDSSSAASRQSPAKLHHDKTPKPRFGSWLTMGGRSSSEPYDTFSAKQKGNLYHQITVVRHENKYNYDLDFLHEQAKLHKKISEMKEIIEARESKLFDLSRANAELQEANSDLRSQLESQDVNQMSEEFMQRLAALERKFQQAIREKEVLRKQLDHAKAAAAASEREAESEKDQVIAELREEGEKLSKQQLSLNNMIKKLRATEKDNQKSINSLKEQLEEANQELERAKKSLSAKEEVERSQIEAVHQLTKSNQQLDKSAVKLQGQVDTLTSSMAAMQKELDESRDQCRQLSEEAAKAVRSAEDGVRRRLEEELETASGQQHQLEATIHELRDKLGQALEANVQRETELREENSSLLRRLAEAESRGEEQSDAVSAVTRPLLRQIEALTTSNSQAAANWEKAEQGYLNNIGNLQSQLSQLEESERASREECARLSSANANLEVRCAQAQQEIENLKTKIATLTAQNEAVKEETSRQYSSDPLWMNITMSHQKQYQKKRDYLQCNLQSQLSQLEESERASREECARLSSANANLEVRCAQAQQEIENLKTKIATLTAQNEAVKEETSRMKEELESEKVRLQGSVEEAKRETRAMEQQLAVERAAVEAEKRKNNVLHDALRTRGASNTSPQTTSPRSSPTLSFGRVSVSESMGSTAWPTFGEDAFESASTSGRLGFENVRPEYNTSFIESLQAHLKLRDGEVQQMQWELTKRDTERAELRDELAAMTARAEDQGAQLAALATQYDALLQMYGEKMEESQELRMDLQDVKDMYKAQIDQLLKKEPSPTS
ncbi:TATA element modulatory factor [Nilaparvata lugens]|uniref:TATA element modulatory factor n=1 Tax=Nilaparvata lugens TaxID=108931 RepID=UPI00193DD1CF|nr:TATA element modulatory factor [Nilaparvata lugens]